LLVAVSTNLDEPLVILADLVGTVAYDGYVDTTFVPIQARGGSRPTDAARDESGARVAVVLARVVP
jgi:hypothetical protein